MKLFEPTIPNSHSARITSGQGVATPANWRFDQSGFSVVLFTEDSLFSFHVILY
jgi:hypothetical protein